MSVKVNAKMNIDKKKFRELLKISRGIAIYFDNNAEYPDGTPVETAAMWLEKGTSKMPPRPFVSKTIKKRKRAWLKKLAKTKDFDVMGKDMVNDIKKTILYGEFEKLADSTIKKKGHDDTLIDTGLLYDSIMYRKLGGL